MAGNKFRPVLIILLALFGAGLAFGNPGSTPSKAPTVNREGNQAWFISALVEPVGKEIEGLPLSEISKDWDLATVLSLDLALAGAKNSPDFSHLSFVLDISYPTGIFSDRAFAGVYKKKKGEIGRFLLILRRKGGTKWKKSFLLEEPFSLGFSFLDLEGQKLTWGDCYNCDSFIEVEWVEDSYRVRVISVGK